MFLIQICSSEEVGHGRTLLSKMAEVTLIDFLYLNRLALSTFTEVGPQFSNQDSRLGPVIEKAKKLSTLQYPRSIGVTSYKPPLVADVYTCIQLMFVL